jgi:hypothetical protein
MLWPRDFVVMTSFRTFSDLGDVERWGGDDTAEGGMGDRRDTVHGGALSLVKKMAPENGQAMKYRGSKSVLDKKDSGLKTLESTP